MSALGVEEEAAPMLFEEEGEGAGAATLERAETAVPGHDGSDAPPRPAPS